MTIYWDRCQVCGRYVTTKQCTLHPEISVCIHCCLSCVERDKCPRPVWEIRLRKPVEAKARLEDKKKLMEELLSKLDTGSSIVKK